jgi:exoribonuclease-2
VRLEEVPLLLHVAGLGVHARGTRLLLEVVSVDELRVEASCRLLQVLGAAGQDEPDAGQQGEDDAPGDETPGEAGPESDGAATVEQAPGGGVESDGAAAADEHGDGAVPSDRASHA